MHGLGNANYFQTTVAATGQMVNGSLVIALDADYVRGVDNIDVSSGVIAHGVDQEDLEALQNFRDYVFSSSSQNLTASIETLETEEWVIFPNPSLSGNVTIDYNQLSVDAIRVSNVMGQEVALIDALNGSVEVELPESGVYFVSLLKYGKPLSTKRIVKQ